MSYCFPPGFHLVIYFKIFFSELKKKSFEDGFKDIKLSVTIKHHFLLAKKNIFLLISWVLWRIGAGAYIYIYIYICRERDRQRQRQSERLGTLSPGSLQKVSGVTS